MRFPAHSHRYGQQGVALIIGLLLLLVLSIAALTAMRLVANQSAIARNVWAAQMSLSSAQGSLAMGRSLVLTGDVTSGDGIYAFDALTDPQWSQNAFSWSSGNVLALANFSNSQYPGSKASAIVEQLPSVAAPGQSLCTGYGCNGGILSVYRVTARAVGPTGKVPRVVQETVIQ